jgi:hypothetical protein
MACPELQRRRFATKENEEIVHLASEDRKQGLSFEIVEDKTNPDSSWAIS